MARIIQVFPLPGGGHVEGGAASSAEHERYLSVIVSCTPLRVGPWRSDSSLSINSLFCAAEDMNHTPTMRYVLKQMIHVPIWYLN